MVMIVDRGLLRIADVVKLTGIGRATIYELIARGDFVPRIRLSPGRIAFRAEDIERWVESRRESI
ncbi:AlpA family phage regulatory protein [Burkholderia pyrrocinia]|nr:AlpA family phage regulatory protein [Burkholderia pyrrocinia]